MNRLYSETDWPHGLVCSECMGQFVDGQPIHERLDSMIADTPLVVLICRSCALTGAINIVPLPEHIQDLIPKPKRVDS